MTRDLILGIVIGGLATWVFFLRLFISTTNQDTPKDTSKEQDKHD